MKWVIYYTDGDTYSNEDGEPADAPGGGVAAIAQEDSVVGLLVFHGEDYYAFSECFGGWCGIDALGFVQYIERPGVKVIKLGENMDLGKYRTLFSRITIDPDLPKKSAFYPWETRV